MAEPSAPSASKMTVNTPDSLANANKAAAAEVAAPQSPGQEKCAGDVAKPTGFGAGAATPHKPGA